ncbi:MAG: phosphoribosylaminoimidazolesuccinocarboxamide synthase [Chloroflexota bacterium]
MISHDDLLKAIPRALTGVDVPGLGEKVKGKVRDIYRVDGRRVLITTDRVSAFDRVLGYIPYRGQVLNQLSLWWFDQTQAIVPNHVIATPDPNVTIAREAKALPVEVIVRGFITGVTGTSMWTLYEQGDRMPYGILLPEGLSKNDPLPQPVITPTTKATDGGHDERLTRDELLGRGLVDRALWERIEMVALALFDFGQRAAEQAGLILVDTKYEFGLVDGELLLIDEIHTPDSSRYWVRDSYGGEGDPEHYDKEYLRLWFAGQGYRGEGEPPNMPDDFIAQVAGRYIDAYERLTGRDFRPAAQPTGSRIADSLHRYFAQS